jgi:hypothetical protein
MKGNEIIDYMVRNAMPDMEQVREKCLCQAVTEKRRIKRPFLITAVTLATAAALVICSLLGNTLFNSKVSNSFFIKAYALEQQDDGSFKLSDTTTAYSDGIINSSDLLTSFAIRGTDATNYYYKSIFLSFEGANIKNIEFFADDNGKFAKTYHEMENGEFVKDYIELYDDYTGNLIGVGYRYSISQLQHLGSTFKLETKDLTKDLLLLVGRESLRGYVSSELNITVHAVATFNDGTKQEETFFVY